MRAFVRYMLLLVLAGVCTPPLAAAAQSTTPASAAADVSSATRAQALDRFRVIVIRDGLVLTPRSGEAKTIEISNGSVALDGTPVSGRELREALGGDADVVIQLSYASPDALRAAFAAPAAPSVPTAPEPSAAPEAAVPPQPQSPPASPIPDREWRRKSGAKVNVFGSIEVEEDERVTEAVVAIFGDVDVRGYVEEDVVAVLGSVRLGPRAVVRGEVTSVGGRIVQERGAEVRGNVNEVRLGGGAWRFGGGPWQSWSGHDMFSGWFSLLGTLLRIGLVMLLALIVAVVATGPIDRISRRVAADPWVSGFVGLLAQVLFVPVLVLTIVFLAISIVGIPLLLLVPFALVALLFGVLMGFTGVARRVGEWAVGPYKGPLVATIVGVAVITAGAIVTRIVWLIPGPIAPLALVLWMIALFVEYVAWTVGLGALLLTRFGTRGPSAPPLDVVPPPVPPPVPAERVVLE